MRRHAAAALAIFTASTFSPSAGATSGDGFTRALDNAYYKVHLDVRTRIELADFEGSSDSQGYTVRTRLGIGTKPFHGLSLYAEGENVVSFADSRYFDTVETPTGQSPIADPETTELNRLFVRYANPKLLSLDAIVGRQRIQLDDQRFVGNVGWRQNEQTFDAVFAAFSPLEKLRASYGYLWEVRRIFGDQGPAARRDFDSRSHVIRLAFDGIEGIEITAFAYLFDFENSRGNSSNSYGFRFSGRRPLTSPLSLGYAGSYALQTDAGSNPTDYTAHYAALEGQLMHQARGAVSLGYELLGSDGGRARFVTPLATAHKFNGWADAFLGNGGVNGLQDLYVSISPKLAWSLEGKLVYHHFWSDEGGASLGDEIDVVVSRRFGKHVSLLAKAAWFEATSRGPASRWRFWLDLTFRY